jgi:TetR/AcrR family transcriptional regulator
MPRSIPAEGRAEITRKAILRAAIREFSTHGLAGARTEAIAQSAKVNKALLYYYFKSKSALYTAAIEQVSEAVAERALAALDPRHSPGERVLRTALTHFDRILTQRDFQSLMQHEMARTKLGKGEATPLLVKNLFKPMLEKLQHAVHEGVQSGEMCPVDWLQVVYSVIGANVIFFVSAPMMHKVLGCDPLTPASIAARRRAAIEFLGNALFVDRSHGSKLVRRLLTEMPMPKNIHPPVWRKHV